MTEKDWQNKAWNLIYRQRNVEKAIEYLDNVIEKYPQNDEALAIKANALNQLAGDTKKWDYSRDALKCAEKAIEINPRNDTALFNKAWSLCDLGNPEEALEYANKALEINSQNIYAWYNKAWAHYLLHEFETAIDCCDKIIQIDANYTDLAELMKWRIKRREFPEHLAKFKI